MHKEKRKNPNNPWLWLGTAAAIAGGLLANPAKQAEASPYIGINIQNAADYNGDLTFADAMKESRDWTTTAGVNLTGGQLDANRWPNQDAKTYVWAGASASSSMAGTYTLTFNGQATLTITAGSGTITNQVYNSGTNTTTATLTMNDSDLNLQFTNTKKTAASGTNTGFTNCSLMRPTSPGASTSYAAGTLFTTQLKNLIAKFNAIRFMDWLATNANQQTNWSDRLNANAASYNISAPAGYGWQGYGASWEHAVAIANQTNKDMWICIPEHATDAYVTNVANLIAFGSDGVNPYTSAQGSPVWAPLNAGLKVYVEFSNEVWNTGGGFTQSGDNHTQAINEVNAGGSPLNWDGETSDWYWAARRTAKRTVEISNIFRTVFGSGAMMSRVRPVLESQEGYVGFWILEQTHMLEDYYNNASKVATPHPPSYYIYGGGGSAYYNPDNSNTSTIDINTIWTSQSFDATVWAPTCQGESNYALPVYGKRLAYEGGPSMDSCNCSTDAVKQQAWSDARMANIITGHQTTWNQNGGDLLMYFDSVGGYQWAFAKDVNNLNTPKLNGINTVNGSTTATGTYGVAIPGTVTASAYKSPESWAGANPSSMVASGNWTFLGYVVTNSSSSAYNISLSAGSSGTTNKADIYVDGALAGTITIPNTGSNTTYATSGTVTTATLPAGSHGFLIKASAGSFGVNTATFTATAGSPPPAPTGLTATAGNTQVALTWNASTGATAYDVKRSTVSGSGYVTVSSPTVTNYTNTGLTNGTTYYFVVDAKNAGGTSANSSQASATPNGAAPQAQIPNTATAPTIDGNVDAAWSAATSYGITHVAGTISSGADLTASWQGLWDATNLYILATVTDDVKTNDSVNAWDDDSVEVYLDADHNGGTTYDANDRQIVCGWGDAAPVEGGGRAIAGAAFGKADPTGTSYRIEAKIPWAIEAFTPAANAIIGVDIHVNDDDDGGARDGKLMWNDTTDGAWGNPSLFGTGKLLAGGAPPVPTGLTATPGNTQVALSWNASTGATAYDVKRSTVNGSGYVTVSSPTVTNYTNTGLTNGTTYYFVVDAKNASGTSANSAQVSATPAGTVTVTFNAAPLGNQAGTYTESGFSFVEAGGDSHFFYGTANGYANTVYHPNNWNGTTTVTKSGGGAFNLASFNYAGSVFGDAGDATVTGTHPDLTTVQTSYSFTSSKTESTLTLNWTNLTKVDITFAGGTNTAYGALDQFVFN